MNARIRLFVLLAGVSLWTWCAGLLGEELGAPTYLLNISKGEKFTEIGSDDKTNPVPVDPKDPAKGLKVKFDPGDSVGQRKCSVNNWNSFKSLQISVVNPSEKLVRLYLNVFQSATPTTTTRVVTPVDVPPGERVLEIPIADIRNAKGDTLVLSDVKRWYFADRDNVGPTLIFRDVSLSKGAAPVAASPTARAPATGLKGRYRIRGRVGSLEVDLTLEPLDDDAPASPREGANVQPLEAHGEPVYGQSDPSKVERIRAAKMPTVEKPVSFDTPDADAICEALEIFPPDNPWNIVIDDWPVHPNSQNLVASPGLEKPFRCNADMGFIFVPSNQKTVPVKITGYPDESDKGPFPIPNDVPIEGWPLGYPGMTLEDVQRKKEETDRHALVVDPQKRMLYEFYQLRRAPTGWEATCSAIFDLKSNKLRPKGWTSTDAAGLPIFPAVVRYDELKRGIVEHAMRFTIVRSRKAYVYPATHHAGHTHDANVPRMGERFRLKKDYDISRFSPEAQAILKGLKKYGMFVADNGLDWAISVAPDKRMARISAELREVKGRDFEVVEAPSGYALPK
jgi:hypothetical protein